MAIEINGKIYRNIQEQVAENQNNIADLVTKIDKLEDAVLPLTDDNPIQVFDENTFADVTTYLEDGHKLLYTVYNDRLYVYSNSTSTYHEFICMYSASSRIYYRRLQSGDTWTASYKNLQNEANMTQSISNSSTMYPSAAAVYEYVKPKYMENGVVGDVYDDGVQIEFGDKNPFNSSQNKWIGVFTMGNCFFIIPLYGLSKNTTYKTNGTFVYSSLGEVVSTTVNYRIDSNSKVSVWSGNENFTFQNGYTCYLSLIKYL